MSIFTNEMTRVFNEDYAGDAFGIDEAIKEIETLSNRELKDYIENCGKVARENEGTIEAYFATILWVAASNVANERVISILEDLRSHGEELRSSGEELQPSTLELMQKVDNDYTNAIAERQRLTDSFNRFML